LIRANENNPNFVIIDVCTPEEYSEKHLKNAVNLDFYSDDFIDNLKKLDKNKTYLVYCRVGRRSQKSMDIMKELGFKRVYNMLGGITHWTKEEYPVSKN
jgi:rhodanese-related sulfurtransferase